MQDLLFAVNFIETTFPPLKIEFKYIYKNPGLKKYIPVFGWQKSIETPKSESFLGNYFEQSNICAQQMHWN